MSQRTVIESPPADAMSLADWTALPEDVPGGVLDSVPGCEGLTLDLDALWDEIDWNESP